MKKVCILFNHFQVQDGIARTAVGLANEFAKNEQLEVTLRPLFKFDKKMLDWLSPRVKIKPILRFYFRGLAKLVDIIPDSILYKLLINGKYDVEIGFCMTLPIKIVAAGKKQGVTRYAWIHGYDNGLTLLDSYKKMDKVISVSRCGAERFIRESGGDIAADYCYNLVDDNKVREMGKAPIDIPKPDATTFVAVGRLEAGKGIKRLIECAARLKSEGYKLHLWLIGDGEERAALEARAKELDASDIVTFLGSQRNPHAYTSKADVLVCASFSEGYSTVCTEAIMLGVPVLTTAVSGGEEIIADAESGLLVGLEDNDVYLGMKQILDNPELIPQWKSTLLNTRAAFSYDFRAQKLHETLGL